MDTSQLRTAMSFGEALGQLLCIACITIMSTLFGVKVAGDRLQHLNYPRILVLLLYFMSWAFTNMSAVLLSTNTGMFCRGTGTRSYPFLPSKVLNPSHFRSNKGNFISCSLSILACDVFYALSNIIMYLWLIERVWLVTSVRTSRMESLLYKFHLVLLTPYIGIFSLMLPHFPLHPASLNCLSGMVKIPLLSDADQSPNFDCLHNLPRRLHCKRLCGGLPTRRGKRFCLLVTVFVGRNIERDLSPLGA
ncbi:hypothetical protein BC936DRAFT_143808 [Jimgerdemannia flammicorona]|uniref:Uncharacterized protein n=1 Tax=Jimgerdemannia flammicorona TaxID=994334 RepID=A0A433DDC3_9FUNG|nr:hypothetical protein BC936DRAFT_143808 [Jimgerdemannia flammicorona]